MRVVSNGRVIDVPPRGPAGPDGNPIGTIISFMGVSAPKDYLVCDGAVYSIVDYPDLAEFFRNQFGSVSYFGGDGTSSFAVPDMRNLFLRGYHGDSEKQLSGEIGVEQDATEILNVIIDAGKIGWYAKSKEPNNVDAWSDVRDIYRSVSSIVTSQSTTEHPSMMTSRPINMAVLYCIKAVESPDALIREDVYSTEERRVGTWIDGKPIYSKTIYKVPTPISELSNMLIADNVDVLVRQFGIIPALDSERRYSFPFENGASVANTKLSSNGELRFEVGGSWENCSFYGTFEYTKTTDSEVSS